jgi:hypothetical protein
MPDRVIGGASHPSRNPLHLYQGGGTPLMSAFHCGGAL